MARPMIADGRGHDVFPASEEELLQELRRLDGQFRAEREPRIAVIYAEPEAKVTPKLSIGLGADQAMTLPPEIAKPLRYASKIYCADDFSGGVNGLLRTLAKGSEPGRR